MLQVAFQYSNYMDAGIEIGLDDLPNIVVLDLVDEINQAEKKLKKEKIEEQKRKAKR